MSDALSLDSGTVDQMRRTNTLSGGRVGWVDPRVREGGGGFGVFSSLEPALLLSFPHHHSRAGALLVQDNFLSFPDSG